MCFLVNNLTATLKGRTIPKADVFVGFGIHHWCSDRGHAHSGEVVPGHCRHLPELSQHHARACGGSSIFHAHSHHQGFGVDDQG